MNRGFNGFIWNDKDGLRDIGTPDERVSIIVTDISDDGTTITGWTICLTGTAPFAWKDGVWNNVGDGTDQFGYAFATNNDGSVIVGGQMNGIQMSAIVSYDMDNGFHFETENTSSVKAVTSDGKWGAGYARLDKKVLGQIQVAVWYLGESPQTIYLGSPTENLALARDIADHTNVISVISDNSAWIWDSYSWSFTEFSVLLERLGSDLNGFEIREIRGMNNDGTAMVGWGFDENGITRAWHATIPYIRPGDHNRDGTFTNEDVLDFLNDYVTGSMRADTSNDGSVNTVDIVEFFNDWNMEEKQTKKLSRKE